MGAMCGPPLVKRFCGIIFREGADVRAALGLLAEAWGGVEECGEPFPFAFTDYYCAEMGGELLRQFVSFCPAVPAEALPEWKVFSNRVERLLADGGRRTVNLDPGYLDLARIVLLSTKDFSHRVHLGGGVYAEVSLLYRAGGFDFLPWTYPDYRTQEALSFFTALRRRFKGQMRQAAHPAE